MNITDVIALSKAGFTSEQIIQMSQLPEMQQTIQPTVQNIGQQIQQPQVMPQLMPQQMPQQMIQPQQSLQPQVQQPTEDPFMKLFEQMSGIKKAIQDNNIANSQISAKAPQTTDDILASIIQPTKPKEE